MSCNGILSLHTLLLCSDFLIFMTWFVSVYVSFWCRLWWALAPPVSSHAMANKINIVVPRYNPGQVVYTHSVANRYNVILYIYKSGAVADWRDRPTARLGRLCTSPCVADSLAYPSTGSWPRKGRGVYPPTSPVQEYGIFSFTSHLSTWCDKNRHSSSRTTPSNKVHELWASRPPYVSYGPRSKAYK